MSTWGILSRAFGGSLLTPLKPSRRGSGHPPTSQKQSGKRILIGVTAGPPGGNWHQLSLTKESPDLEPSWCAPASGGSLCFNTFTAGGPTPERPSYDRHPISASAPHWAFLFSAFTPCILALHPSYPCALSFSKPRLSVHTHLGRYTSLQHVVGDSPGPNRPQLQATPEA